MNLKDIKAILITIFIMMCYTPIIHGQHLVRGIILDKSTKEPLIGASILAKGTTIGTVADFDGSFELTVQSPNAVLIVQYIGFTQEEIEIKGRNNLDIFLKGNCTKCWFDSQEINIFIFSGLLNTPYGGKLEVSSPVVFNEPVLRILGKYQADFRSNNYLNLGASLNHLLSTCRFDADISLLYNRFRFESLMNIDDYSAAVNLNWSRRVNPVLGVKSISFAKNNLESINNKILYGIGGRSVFGFPIPFEVNSLIYFDSSRINYYALLKSHYKSINIILEFYRFGEVSELSLGFGYEFRYLSKRQKSQYLDRG